MQIPSVEPPSPEELPGSITLPEPPVEIEASGSVPDVLDGLHEPTTPEEEGVSLEETATEDEVETEEINIHADTSGAEEERFEPTVVTVEDENLDEAEEELEISTVITETIEEQGLPAQIPVPVGVEITGEEPQPEAAETGLLPVGDNAVEGTPEESNFADAPPANEEVNPPKPEDAAINVVLASSEEPVFDEDGFEESTGSEGQEVKEETVPEAPIVVEVAPEISTEDLTDDEILLVNKDVPEPPVTDSLSPAEPTALSPERESPFTHVADVDPDFDVELDRDIPSLVEVKQ